ncbi:RNA-dependent RNA polymerase [Morchella esculenta fusarivirus 2]|uniref:RNA-dependent RNA polymerase n=1 Tax=Morchella esculenta fusarivirus 2 TaxID=2830907 RepID=A0AAE7RAW3_9VIRU|nr:RNA-dependent RNA polymerase [Morchella esculenta fusarivirus 2]
MLPLFLQSFIYIGLLLAMNGIYTLLTALFVFPFIAMTLVPVFHFSTLMLFSALIGAFAFSFFWGFIGLYLVMKQILGILSFGTSFTSIAVISGINYDLGSFIIGVATESTIFKKQLKDMISHAIPASYVEEYWKRVELIGRNLQESIDFNSFRGIIVLLYVAIWSALIVPILKRIWQLLFTLIICFILSFAWGFFDNNAEYTVKAVLNARDFYRVLKNKTPDNPRFMKNIKMSFKYNRIILYVYLVKLGLEFNFIVNREGTTPKMQSSRGFMAVMRSGMMRFSKKMNTLDLPQFIRARAEDRLSSEETLQLAAELGYPISKLKIAKPQYGIAGGEFDMNLAFGTNWSFPQPKYRETIAKELRGLGRDLEIWRHSYVWSNISDQIRATSRYFGESHSRPIFTEWELDQVWETLKPIYDHSMITPLEGVLQAWNKRFNVGAFAFSNRVIKDGSFRRMKRREDIARFKSQKDYIKYWKSLFYYAPIMQHFSHFMTKSEYLPERKWKQRKVRTPIASWLPQYLSQIVFSWEPNHRFHYETTPVKVGMPLNGAVMGKMFKKHLKLKFHFAGDCTAFDSTITKPVVEIIKAIRKKGFTHHKQYEAICTLIDVAYENLLSSKLVSAQTGNVYNRADHGLGTGHASTSGDNSLVMCALYLLAWARLTGQPAAEFRRHNELSIYGDDHVLSIDDMAPSVWTFKNIQSLLKSWDIDMRLEVGNYEEGSPFHLTPFLSKFARTPTTVDKEECMNAMGFVPEIIVIHDVDKLMAKALAPNVRPNPQDRMERLLSMIRLTAHRPDAYNMFALAIFRLGQQWPDLAAKAEKIPSYNLVIQQWYNPKSNIPEKVEISADDPETEAEFVYHIGEWTLLDLVTHFASIVPDVVNPKIYNYGYVNILYRKTKTLLEWPKQLIALSNKLTTQGAVADALRQSAYDWIPVETPLDHCQINTGSLLFRHWLYMAFRMKFSFSYAAILDTFQKKIYDMGFILNGKIPLKVKKLDLPLWNLSLVVALNFVYVPDFWVADLIVAQELPRFDLFCKKIFSIFVNRVWTFVPPGFRNLKGILDLAKGELVLITSPTGSGKSTAMVNYLASESIKSGYEKLIVIEPRALLVKSLVSYMNKAFSDFYYSGATTGMKLDEKADVWYITPQELFIRPDFFISKHRVYLVDEAHLDEVFVKASCEYLPRRGCLTLAATATPSEFLTTLSTYEVVLDLPVVYFTHEETLFINAKDSKEVKRAYISLVLGLIKAQDRVYGTWLIFCPKIPYVDDLALMLPGKTQTIVRGTSKVLPGCKFYVATSVADVGLTIPDVDFVITLGVKPTRDHPTSKNWTLLDNQTCLQRRGRTGRTNNGTFYKVDVVGLPLIEEAPKDSFEIATEFCEAGGELPILLELGWVNLKQILEAEDVEFSVDGTRRFLNCFAQDPARDDDAILGYCSDKFFKTAMEPVNPDLDVRTGRAWGDKYFLYFIKTIIYSFDMDKLADFIEKHVEKRKNAGLVPKMTWQEMGDIVMENYCEFEKEE